MKISAELSLYPLDALNQFNTLEVRTQAMSTEIFGDYDEVFAAIQSATRTVFETDPTTVLVAKFLNRDRRQ